MTTLFFTVVIPTYNRAGLLLEAIQSVLDQTFGDFELIVVDDYSTDGTKDVVGSFRDDRIKYIINDHAKGGAGTRNAGIFRARGEWIAFLDDDDIWLPKKLELQYKKIQECDDTVGLIYSGYTSYDFDKKQEVFVYIPEKEGWILDKLLYKNYIGTFSTVVIKTTLLKHVGGLDERFKGMQDMELYVNIARLSKIAFVNEKLTYVRQSNKDRISLNPLKKLTSSLLFWEKYSELINRNPRLRHRAASRVFVNAFKQENWKYMFKVLPWTLAGLLFDIPNCIWVLRYITSTVLRNRLC